MDWRLKCARRVGSDANKSRFVKATNRDLDKVSGNSNTAQNLGGRPPESNNRVEEPMDSEAPSIQAVGMDQCFYSL